MSIDSLSVTSLHLCKKIGIQPTFPLVAAKGRHRQHKRDYFLSSEHSVRKGATMENTSMAIASL